jgi:hypothetical protein
MKKLQVIKTLISISFLFLLIQCDQWDRKMKIVNNSSSAIYYNDSYMYPDTTLRIDDNPISLSRLLVASGETVSNPRRGRWEEVFDICDTLMIFIFDETTLKTVPWDTVRKNYMILKRYDLSLEDLVRMDWRVTYP